MSCIFISYVEEDRDVALQIADALERAGHSVWYYERDAEPGLSYLEQIDQAIERSTAVVLILSTHSLGSWQVDKEIVRAHEAGKAFLPVLRDISHAEFQRHRPGWRVAIGAATSVSIPPGGVGLILPRLLRSLQQMAKLPAEASPTAPVTAPAQTSAQRYASWTTVSRMSGAALLLVVGLLLLSLTGVWNPLQPERSPSAYYQVGDTHFERGEFDRAIAAYSKALRLDSTYFDAYIGRGLAYHGAGEFDRAIEDFTTAIRLNPRSSIGYYNRGRSFGAKRDYAQAIADATEAIRLNPGDFMAYFNRGWAREHLGEYDLAIQDYQQVLELSPADEDARIRLAAVRARQNQLRRLEDGSDR